LARSVTICFRTSESLRNELEKIAGEDRRTLSSTIENILYDHIEKRKSATTFREEKRRFPRKNVSVPALISMAGAPLTEPRVGMLVDISLGGLRISVPGGLPLELRADGESSRLSIVFTLPHIKKALTVQAVPRHVFKYEDDTGIGTSFVDADLATYQMLRTYLMN